MRTIVNFNYQYKRYFIISAYYKGVRAMLIKLLRRLFGKWAVILSHKEYNALIKDYEYKRDFERTLSAMEYRLHSCGNADVILEENLQTACKFYQADWAGFLDISKDQTMWSPYIWYNTDEHDMTRELTDEFEPTAPLSRWMTALNMDMPFFCQRGGKREGILPG